ncbi:MAG: DUF5337 family protein [Pseudomonadota bacterium]
MTREQKKSDALARQGRIAAIVVAVSMVLWLGAQWVGGQIGLAARYAFLFDFAAMAAFAWGLIVSWQIWRKRGD